MNIQDRKNMTKNDWIDLSIKLATDSHNKLKKSQESFKQVDTDGFLSQTTTEMSAEVDRANSNICRKFGKSNFMGLYFNNKRVKAKQVHVKCNYSFSWKTLWLLHEDEQKNFGNRKFLPCNHGRGSSKILNKFNLKECNEIDDAWAKFGKNFSLSPFITRLNDEWGTDSKLQF